MDYSISRPKDTAKTSSTTKVGDWAFAKFIVSSDGFFMDERWVTANDYNNYSNIITNTSYEAKSRKRFYGQAFYGLWSGTGTYSSLIKEFYTGNDLYSLYRLNDSLVEVTANPIQTNNWLQPSKQYYNSTIFDQLATGIGGWNNKDYIRNTNQHAQPWWSAPGIDSNDNLLYGKQFPFFWGPVFTDGYKSLVKNNDNTYVGENIYFNRDSVDQTAIDFWNGELTLKHIPAELGSIILDHTTLYNNYAYLGAKHIYQPNYPTPFYGTSSITTSNSIQFSPLQAEAVGYDDPLSPYATDINRQFYTYDRWFITNIMGSDLPQNTLWGALYARVQEGFIPKQWLETNSTCGAYGSAAYSQETFNNLTEAYTIPYDCYISRVPRSKPIGSTLPFQDSGDNEGANCVGIVAARNRVKKSGGGTITFEVTQNFGLNSRKTVTGYSDIFSVIGGMFFGSAGTTSKQNVYPQWGSTADSYYSFGTTALHTRVFDAWPISQTIYDGRYFGVLHFNEGILYSTVNSLSGVDQTSYSVDFRVPTYSGDLDNAIVPSGTIIYKNTLLRKQDQWRVNPVRRGQLLTPGNGKSGFNYYKHVIGLNDAEISIPVAGAKFTVNEVVSSSNSVKIKVTCVNEYGGITSFQFMPEGQGEGFLPSTFPCSLTFKPANPEGISAKLNFYSGKVWMKQMNDPAPTEHITTTRLTSSSNGGVDVITNTNTVKLELDSNSTGEYDCFYFFHNDITHTTLDEWGSSQIAGFAQNIKLTIT